MHNMGVMSLTAEDPDQRSSGAARLLCGLPVSLIGLKKKPKPTGF